ncbi:MAG TPA: hypothetical protein VIM59_17620 [Cellvibrio sp.]
MTLDVLFIHSAGPQSGDEGGVPLVEYLRHNLGPNFNVSAPLVPLLFPKR